MIGIEIAEELQLGGLQGSQGISVAGIERCGRWIVAGCDRIGGAAAVGSGGAVLRRHGRRERGHVVPVVPSGAGVAANATCGPSHDAGVVHGRLHPGRPLRRRLRTASARWPAAPLYSAR